MLLFTVFRSSVGAFGWLVETGASRGPNFRMGGSKILLLGGLRSPESPRFPRTAPLTGPCLSDRGPNDFRRKSAQNVPASNQPMKIGTLGYSYVLHHPYLCFLVAN